jgi:hypothetical protein
LKKKWVDNEKKWAEKEKQMNNQLEIIKKKNGLSNQNFL